MSITNTWFLVKLPCGMIYPQHCIIEMGNRIQYFKMSFFGKGSISLHYGKGSIALYYVKGSIALYYVKGSIAF